MKSFIPLKKTLMDKLVVFRGGLGRLKGKMKRDIGRFRRIAIIYGIEMNN